MKKYVLFLLPLLLITAAACNAGETDETDYDGPVFHSEYAFHFFAITPDSEVYGLLSGQPVGKYTADGELLDTYPGTENFSKLCYSDGFLYAYDQTARAFVELDITTKNIRVINNDSDAVWWVRSMAVSGGSVYAATVKNPGDESFLSDGYRDYGGKECFIEVDIGSGQLTEHTNVKKPFAIYLSSNGTLYIYSHPDEDYVLYAFNTKSKKLKKDAEMNDAGYTTAFVREGNFFVFSRTGCVSAKNMKDKQVSDYVKGTSPGNDMVFHSGNIVFSDRSAKTGKNAFRNFLLGKSSLKSLGVEQTVDIKGEITVTGRAYAPGWDTDALLRLTGILAKLELPYESTEDYRINNELEKEFLTSIMAGNPDVDIYILSSTLDAVRTIKKTGYYVPLNDSAPIQGYFDRCFDWVGESAKAPNGDTWALPVSYGIMTTFYVPENLERFGITPEDLATFDGYLDTLNRINPIKGDEYITYYAVGNGEFDMQYDSLCRDSGVYNYDTPLYRNLLEKQYSGWRRMIERKNENYGRPGYYHPVTEYDWAAYRERDPIGQRLDWEPDRMIFQIYSIDNAFFSMGAINNQRLKYKEDLDADTMDMYIMDMKKAYPDFDPVPVDPRRWRVMPMPRISEDVKHNYAWATFAFVNPYGKNKELAVEYLEAVADNILAVSYYNGDDWTSAPFENAPQFTLKDLSAYEGYYDMNIPLFTDIHNIFRDGAIGEVCVPSDPLQAYTDRPCIADYQDGKITLDQAVAARQREVDMWLYE